MGQPRTLHTIEDEDEENFQTRLDVLFVINGLLFSRRVASTTASVSHLPRV